MFVLSLRWKPQKEGMWKISTFTFEKNDSQTVYPFITTGLTSYTKF